MRHRPVHRCRRKFASRRKHDAVADAKVAARFYPILRRLIGGL